MDLENHPWPFFSSASPVRAIITPNSHKFNNEPFQARTVLKDPRSGPLGRRGGYDGASPPPPPQALEVHLSFNQPIKNKVSL